MQAIHQSVLLAEVVDFLAPVDGGVYVDCNLGLGGHTEGILAQCGPSGRVIGFDWDASALALARQRLAPFGDRVHFVHQNFASVRESLMEIGVQGIDGLLLDLGLSSLQLDDSGRGFSFKGSEPLDMRMDERIGLTAAELINRASEDDLADIFYYYGEERQARRIAAWIVEERKKDVIATTDQLVDIVYHAVPRRFHPKKIHVATKVFQALRIAVNRELENLKKVLEDGAALLKPGAKFCVISFHSLEDRMVKQAFRDNSSLRVLTAKPVLPGAEECQRNPRARSAKLRVAQAEGC
ncbi:MAG: 16S rRNA (cytosine(1402)-N(4))-methyltransferase RsmH [Desulfobulbaceae bacterium]|nr:16S rRNA (cytosine(1402)-N(4))-methyltransferase RsmH [Desulfobulbaceae bacterium]HIJ79356.1 16S rRNA (cytosine(1402)-N(4))-methyltransferase RsmH [Deltaproteobacteria bacterium]